MMKLVRLALALAPLLTAASLSAGVVYSDDFERANSTAAWGTATTKGAKSGGEWTFHTLPNPPAKTPVPVNGGAADANNFNVSSGLGLYEAGTGGTFFALQTFDPIVLAGERKTATWCFNGRYDRGAAALSWNEIVPTVNRRGGFGMILAANGPDLSSAQAKGYALVSRMLDPAVNQAGTPVLQLIRFEGPFGDQANWKVLIQTDASVFGGVSTRYITAVVDFDGATHTWSLQAAGNLDAFTNPLALNGPALTAVDSAFTGMPMTHGGVALYSSNSPANDYRFDNLSFSVGTTEPVGPGAR